MLILPPAEYRHRRGKPSRNRPLPPPPPATGPVLVVAIYDELALKLHLTFDRPIDISHMNGGYIVVIDPVINHKIYQARGPATHTSAPSVELGLVETGTHPGSAITLTGLPGNGIVAQDDEIEWAGPNGLPLLFP